MHQFSRYHRIVSHLARQALAQAAEATGQQKPPSRAGAMRVALPAAQRLLGEDVPLATLPAGLALLADAARSGRLVTPTGQSRPVYHPLATHLHLSAIALRDDALDDAAPHVARIVSTYDPAKALAQREGLALGLWQALCQWQAAEVLDEPAWHRAAADAVDHVLRDTSDHAAAPLHPHDPDDQLDAWTYRELAGLHALAHLVTRSERDDWTARLDAALAFHLQHTQPDYTTYEPWGVFAFCRSPATMIFADQQLHDTSANLHLSGGTAALVAGLLLADASHAMSRWPATDDTPNEETP